MFDTYKFDYKSYMLEMYGIINEFPAKLPRRTPLLNDYASNSEEAVWVEKNGKYLKNIASN